MKTIRTVLTALGAVRTEVIILNLNDVDFRKESPSDIRELAKWIATNPNLVQIHLQRTNFGLAKDLDLREFFDAIRQHPKLSFLELTDASISAENVAFMQSLTSCLAGSRIQELKLDHNQVNGQFLATIINGDKNLKILSINSIGLGSWNEADIKYLCSAITCSSLEALFMSQNRLGELECLPILGDAISCCRTLSTLSIPANNIGDHKDAVDFLTKIAGLEYLYLSHNSLVNIGPEGWEFFIAALISKPKGIALDISNNELGLMEEFLLRKGQLFLLFLDKLMEGIPSLKLDFSHNDIIEGVCLISATLLTVKHLSPEEKARLRPEFEHAFKDPKQQGSLAPSVSQFFCR